MPTHRACMRCMRLVSADTCLCVGRRMWRTCECRCRLSCLYTVYTVSKNLLHLPEGNQKKGSKQLVPALPRCAFRSSYTAQAGMGQATGRAPPWDGAAKEASSCSAQRTMLTCRVCTGLRSVGHAQAVWTEGNGRACPCLGCFLQPTQIHGLTVGRWQTGRPHANCENRFSSKHAVRARCDLLT